MKNSLFSRIDKIVGMSIFIALIMILQIIASFIRFGPFSITLALAPIVVGAAVYGAAAGGVFGFAFGMIVLINCVNGIDTGGALLWATNPLLTAFLCLFKGTAAGAASGLVYSVVSKKNPYAGVACAAFVCPVINTGLFLATVFFFFREALMSWAGGSDVVYYMFVGLTGMNFLLELGVNVILSPGIARIITVTKKK